MPPCGSNVTMACMRRMCGAVRRDVWDPGAAHPGLMPPFRWGAWSGNQQLRKMTAAASRAAAAAAQAKEDQGIRRRLEAPCHSSQWGVAYRRSSLLGLVACCGLSGSHPLQYLQERAGCCQSATSSALGSTAGSRRPWQLRLRSRPPGSCSCTAEHWATHGCKHSRGVSLAPQPYSPHAKFVQGDQRRAEKSREAP